MAGRTIFVIVLSHSASDTVRSGNNFYMPRGGRCQLFHKIMKSGCNNKAEESFHINSNRRTAREPAIVFLRPELARFLDDDDLPRRTRRDSPNLALTRVEIGVLDHLMKQNDKAPQPRQRTLGLYLTKIAKLGGYLARAMVAAIGDGAALVRAATLPLGLVSCRNKSRPAIARSSAALVDAAIDTCAPCLFRVPVLFSSGPMARRKFRPLADGGIQEIA